MMRLFCWNCYKSVSSELGPDVIFRAVAICPECIEQGYKLPEQPTKKSNPIASTQQANKKKYSRLFVGYALLLLAGHLIRYYGATWATVIAFWGGVVVAWELRGPQWDTPTDTQKIFSFSVGRFMVGVFPYWIGLNRRSLGTYERHDFGFIKVMWRKKKRINKVV